jgi:hypothetical protein
MSLDLTQSAAAILVQQINADNGTSFTVEQLSFGPVMTNVGADAAEFEVVVIVTGLSAQGWADSFVYKYNRIDLESIFTDSNASYSVDACADYLALLALINTALVTNMQLSTLANNDTNQAYVQGDIVPATLPSPAPAHPSVQFILTADLNSYIYRGAAVLTATTAAQSLAGAITVASTGLIYTPPAPPTPPSDGSDGTPPSDGSDGA